MPARIVASLLTLLAGLAMNADGAMTALAGFSKVLDAQWDYGKPAESARLARLAAVGAGLSAEAAKP